MDERRVAALRRLGAGSAATVAALLLLRLPVELLTTAGWPQADEHQARLAEWSERLATALTRVPPGAVLGFLPERGPGEPLDEVAAVELERIRAALAPRRIAASTEADFVLAHGGALVTLSKTPGFERLDRLEPLVLEWVLVERQGR